MRKTTNKAIFPAMPMTAAQEYSEDFEKLSKEIVEYLFQGADIRIKKTNATKDGGYDIIVECCDGDVLQKIYFECKLRSTNLNLRDISANLIIAFNEGAAALVILTNYDYTQQANENIHTFFEKTVLNVKILIGADIEGIVKKNKIFIPNGLAQIISNKKSLKKNKYQFLKIDLEKEQIYKQFFRTPLFLENNSGSYLFDVYKDEIRKAKMHLLNGETICIEGFLGVGKSSIIKCVFSAISCKTIYIVANNYTSQSQLLLEMFLDIWGIPIHTIVRDFSDEIIEKIVKTINDKSGDQKIGNIIRHLIGKTIPDGVADEYYNGLVCNYLIEVLSMHKTNLRYIFYIENAEKASAEIQILLSYLCKLLIKNQIACVLEKDLSEYAIMDSSKDNIFYNTLKTLYSIPINYLTLTQAKQYIYQELKDYPQSVLDTVLKRGGVRLLTLTSLISFVKEKYRESGQHNQLLLDLQQFTPNELPQSINNLLMLYYQKAPEVFYYFYLLHGKIPLAWADELLISDRIIVDKLVSLKFLSIDDSSLNIANELVMEVMKRISEFSEFSIRPTAAKLLGFLKKQDSEVYIESTIFAYATLKQFDKVYPLLEKHMDRLFKERQYSTFLKFVGFALECGKENLNINKKLKLSIGGLTAWVTKREINSPNAKPLFKLLEELLPLLPVTQNQYYKMSYDYFCGESLFQDCNFQDSLTLSKLYYDKCLNHELLFTKEEWHEKLCITYALSVKELEGNEKALLIFEELNKKFPESFFVRIEYLDHQQCMNFYSNPGASLRYVNEVFSMFGNTARDDYPLPFHEYVDRAMCALCNKSIQEAHIYSDTAIQVLESNGIFSSLGRAFNIKGCVYLCQGDNENARHCFKEACFLLDESKEYLYSWRSRLNLIQLELTQKGKQLTTVDVRQLLKETYMQFKKIYHKKMIELANQDTFYTTREYFALLIFGYAFEKCNDKKAVEILEDFSLQDKQKKYLEHLHQIKDGRIKKAEFSNCAYAIEKYIFIVG